MSRARICDLHGGRHPTETEPRYGRTHPHERLADRIAQISHDRVVHQFDERKEHVRKWTRSLDERARATRDRTQPVG